jgi:hypothetical protein
MSSSDKSSRGVQAGLLIFGIPFIVAISALAFQPQLPAYVAQYGNVMSAVVGVGALGVLLTFLLAWFADRRTVHRLDETIAEMKYNEKLQNKELAAKSEQHVLELAIKQQELDQQLELVMQKAKIRDLENELKIRELKLRLAEEQQGAPEYRPGEAVEELVIENTKFAAREPEAVSS